MFDPMMIMILVLATQNTCFASAFSFSTPPSIAKLATSQKFFLKTLAVEISTKNALW